MRIVILDADVAFRESLAATLRGAGHTVLIARDMAEEAGRCSPDDCDMLFLDPSSQPELFAGIRERQPDIPVIITCANPTIESVLAALRLGAFDYLPKPFTDMQPLTEALERARRAIEAASNERAFQKRILKTFSELSIANEKIQERGYVDETAEFCYSHYFEDILAIELARSQRFNYNFTIISVRLNYLLKRLAPEESDLFSSQIEAVSGFLHQRVRRTDVLVRTDVNEFMIILVETPKDGGIILAQTLREGVAALVPADISAICQAEGCLPVAIGTAAYPVDGVECQELMEKACKGE